ncbi:MAG: hypothetical protein KDF60_20120, partial [Calditrichaeota bacterium]|nr:hypothetical protein [Calditrichota bacterium]
NPGQYIYQYKMDGVDKDWVQNEQLQTVRYFLPPGEYTFSVAASRFLEKDITAIKEIRIVITPPYWKTWWFYTGIGILALSLIGYIFYSYSKSRYQKKLTRIEHEHKIQLERERISRDLHDSIGAYANAVLYNTELLQKEETMRERKALMDDLRFASKDIITSLRETVWALKKENYSAEDCLLRIKNFIQPLTKYYPGINFRVEGSASQQEMLHYTKALNVVRIVQEAVTNAIKHASPKNIIVSSNVRLGKWELVIVDDGKGFDYNIKNSAVTGNGLKNMKQRVSDSGFEIFFDFGTNENGTKISLLI